MDGIRERDEPLETYDERLTREEEESRGASTPWPGGRPPAHLYPRAPPGPLTPPPPKKRGGSRHKKSKRRSKRRSKKKKSKRRS